MSAFDMQASSNRVNLLDLDEAGLRGFFTSIGEKPFRSNRS